MKGIINEHIYYQFGKRNESYFNKGRQFFYKKKKKKEFFGLDKFTKKKNVVLPVVQRPLRVVEDLPGIEIRWS